MSLHTAKNYFKFPESYFFKDDEKRKLSKKFIKIFNNEKDLKSINKKIKNLYGELKENFNDFSLNKKVINNRKKYFKIIKSKKIKKFNFTCPCCGYPTLPPNEVHDICYICFWEFDYVDNNGAKMLTGGPNRTSLEDARKNFEKTLDCEGRKLSVYEKKKREKLIELFDEFLKKKDIKNLKMKLYRKVKKRS